jgi:SAM-dependent methyltransferase
MQSAVRAALPPSAKRAARAALERAQTASIRSAVREQDLEGMVERLRRIVPDLSRQYSDYDTVTEYMETAVRSLHAFQIWLTEQAIDLVAQPGEQLTVVDIGDSAGTHLRYLSELRDDLRLRCLSVNVDSAAVERIRAQGLEAVEARAEDLADHGIDADLFLSFETLEHLTDPVQAVRYLSYETRCRAFVVTVPYVRSSKVGLYHIRNGSSEQASPEVTHIFELSPEDWTLLFQHAGWRVELQRVYRQYPSRSPLRAMQQVWSRTARFGGHEGFWGAVLVRDHTWSERFSGW